jgi:hypothetical protein
MWTSGHDTRPDLCKQERVIKNYIYIGGLVAIPLVLWLLPADFFDSGLPPLCLSQIILHRDCPGCGITRAIQHAMHFDFATAWNFNKLFVIVLPGIIYYWIRFFLQNYRALRG